MRISGLLSGLAALVLALAVAEAPAAAQPLNATVQSDRATQLLFDAVHTNDFAGAEAAVAAGANIDARDRWESTPVELAVDKGYFRIAHFLVSVRNTRQQAATVTPEVTARPVDATQSATAQPSPSRAGARTRSQPSAPQQATAAAVAPAPAAAPAAWPDDRPNPFDPAAPAFGTGLPVVGQVRDGVSPGAAGASADGPLLATDTPAVAASESMR
ncbi:MAG: hypothetical protein JNM75_14405 [Rhodospirillales bacterium]|nr:hypothetical protein [Rhodospirillales bacterium]